MPSKERRKHKAAVGIQDRRRGRERRVHERVAMCLEVDYRCDDTFLFAYITDMSAMGIFIQTTSPGRPAPCSTCAFRTQDGERLDVDGRVIWVNQPHGADSINPGMGVQFVDLPPRNATAILEFGAHLRLSERRRREDSRQFLVNNLTGCLPS
jgi:Tfp pilus assembly protein PilZ